MALVDVDSWLTEFESCNRLHNTLNKQLQQRATKQHLSTDYQRFTSAIQVGLKQYDREVQQLKLKLLEATKTNTITSNELEQRQRQLESLQVQGQQLHQKYTQSISNDRSALLQNSVNEDDAPIIDTHDVHALKQQQIDMLEEQNRGLETLSQTISRQRQLATQLGQEVDDQNDILDNLANTIERVETGVTLETRNIGLVSRRDNSTWGYWVIIFILLAAIIIVAVL